jgi:O-antigen ligase
MILQKNIGAYFLSVLFIIAAVASAFFQEWFLILVPFAFIALPFLVQHPVYLLYILLVTIPWSVEYNFTPSLGTDLPDEPLMLLTAFSILLISIYHRKKWTESALFHPLILLILLQFVWIMVATATSTDKLLSIKYLLAKSWYLLAFLAAPIFFFRDKKILVQSTFILLGSMMLFVFLALYRHAGNEWSFERINDSLQPFFRNHVNYSALLVFMIPLQLAVISLSKSMAWKRLMLFLLIITLGALYFSYARGAWLALFAGILAYVLIRKNWLLPAFILFIMASTTAVFWLKANDRYMEYSTDYQSTIFHTNFREHLIATYQMKDVSTAERFHRWVAGIRMIGDHWKTGLGPSSFYQHYKSYTLPAFKTWVSRNDERSTIHNYFLLLAVEQGLPGLFLFLVLLGALFWYVQRIYHSAADPFWKTIASTTGAILVMVCTVNFLSDLIETDKVGSVFYLCVAVLIVADFKRRKVEG